MWECHMTLRLAFSLTSTESLSQLQGPLVTAGQAAPPQSSISPPGAVTPERSAHTAQSYQEAPSPPVYSLMPPCPVSSSPHPTRTALEMMQKSGPQGRTRDWESEVPELELRLNPKTALWSWANHVNIKPIWRTLAAPRTVSLHISRRGALWIWATFFLLGRWQLQKQRQWLASWAELFANSWCWAVKHKVQL